MADRVMPGPLDGSESMREAVCVHTRKIFDSCRDKDCMEDLRLYPGTGSQAAVAGAIGVRARSAELLYAAVNVEEVAFNRGYFTVDVRFFYRIRGEAYTLGSGTENVSGLCVFDKRVLLFGSEGSAKVFTSQAQPALERTELPTAVVEAVDPIVLNIRLAELSEDLSPGEQELGEIPAFIAEAFPEGISLSRSPRRIYVTLGQFSMIRLERDTQLLMPVYDYCMPEKECTAGTEDDPCALFRRISFPVDEFFPPDTVAGCDSYREAAALGTQ